MDKVPMVFSRDRRFAQRHRVKSAVRVCVWKSRLPEERTESVNLSQCGIFFLTESRLAEGEIVEILLKMPEEISGEPTTEWRCTGHVVRVEPAKFPRGKCGVGIHFYCYEASRVDQPDRSQIPGQPRDRPAPREPLGPALAAMRSWRSIGGLAIP